MRKCFFKGATIVNFLVIAFALGGCMAGSREDTLGQETLSMPAVYTRYLSFPVPSAGFEVEFNPPVLRWPVVKQKHATYDVRLSRDSMFSGEEVIRASNISWAMFNPHQRLERGAWFWQYRAAGREWSNASRFMISEGSVDLVSPPASRFLSGVPQGHPRVLAEQSEIPSLKGLSASQDAKAIFADADKALKVNILKEKDGVPDRRESDEERDRKLKQDASQRLGDMVYRTVVPLCQAWLLSAADAGPYKQRALAIVFEVAAWDPNGVSGSKFSDFSDARCMLAMAIAYDTFYDQLSEKQRVTLKEAIHARASLFYASWVNNQEARLLSGHVWQHILHYFFQTAIAVYGDDRDAEEWLSYAYELFLARAPILGGKDGGWAEGISYFRMNMETMIDIPLFMKKYTGFDFIRSHPWYVNNIAWMIYDIPPGSRADGFGDNTEEVLSPGSEYKAFAEEIAKLTGNPLASWYIQKCDEYEHTSLASRNILRWIRLTKTNSLPMPAASRDPSLPAAKLFREIGLATMHSNPENTKEDLMVSMRSSPFGCYGHYLSDQNCFNVLYGGKRAFFRTGYKVTMQDPHRTGWYQHTKSNNGVLINGEGQPYSTEAFGWMPRFLSGAEIAYVKGDASNAYASGETDEDYGVKKFFRHLLLLKPDIIVIYDELQSEEEAEWSWLIHSMARIELDRVSNSFQSTFDDAVGVGKLWSSVPVKWALADTFDVPAVNWRGTKNAGGKVKAYDDEQWHLKATSSTRTKAMRFLSVLRISADAAEHDIMGDGKGSVDVVAGRWKISAHIDMALSPGLIITDQSGKTAFTTHGERLEVAGKSYEGKGPARLVEIVNGDARVTESNDTYPAGLYQSWLHYNQGKKVIQTP